MEQQNRSIITASYAIKLLLSYGTKCFTQRQETDHIFTLLAFSVTEQ